MNAQRRTGPDDQSVVPPEHEEYAAAAARRTSDTPAIRRWSTPRLGRAGKTITLTLALVLLASALLATGYWLRGGQPPAPGNDSAEAGFARDMTVHHAQAVEMALTIREKSSEPELRALAYDIITSQQHQIGQMFAWLNEWGLPQTTDRPAMAWMSGGSGEGPMSEMSDGDHVGMLLSDGRMPGMASSEDLARLTRLQGTAAEVLFLRLMITHHQAGVRMASAVLDLSDRPEVVRLARAIEQSQTSEISAMRAMLEARTENDPPEDTSEDMPGMPGMSGSSTP